MARIKFSDLFSRQALAAEGSAVREVLKVTQQPEVISFAGGLPSNKAIPDKLITQLIGEILKETPSVLQYGLTEGLPHFRKYLSERSSQICATNYSVAETLVTTGSQQAIYLARAALINPSDIVIVERPTYLNALKVFKEAGCNILEAECDGNGLIPNAVEEILKEHRPSPKFIYTNPDHQNPTGFEMSVERRKALVRLAHQYGILIFEDAAYRDIKFDGQPLSPMASFDDPDNRQVIFAQTASKILSPGLRVGWVHGPEELINKMTILKQGMDVHTPGLNQEIVYRYLSDGYFDQHLPKITSLYRQQAEQMDKALREQAADVLSWQTPKGGMFIWARTKENIDTQAALANIVRNHQVAYVPGAPFYAQNSDKQTLRLNFTKPAAEEIGKGIERLVHGLRVKGYLNV